MNPQRLLTVLLMAITLVVGGVVTNPANAYVRHHLRQAYSCGYAYSDHRLAVLIRAGHWTDGDGVVFHNGTDGSGDPCFSELLDAWHPTIGGFRATVRWYAGSRLLKTAHVEVRNDATSHGILYLDERTFGVDCDATDGLPTLDGQPVTARTTLTRPHFKPRVLTTTFFDESGACGYTRAAQPDHLTP